MITIKLPYSSTKEFDNLLLDLRKQQSCFIRYCFNRFRENKKETEIRHSFKNLNNLDLLDCWLVESSIMETRTIYSTKKDKVLFGGKKNWIDLLNKVITKNEWKEKRIMPLTIYGEKLQKGNRKFNLDSVNNTLTFKFNRKQHHILYLPKNLRGFYQKELSLLEERTNNKEIPYSVKIDNKYVYISFEQSQQSEIKLKNNRVMSIDMNPNEIGYSVIEFDKNDEFKIIDSGIISLEKLNKSLNEKRKGLNSQHSTSVYCGNKRKHEIFQISKLLIEKCKHYQCQKFVIEDLNISNKNHNKGKKFNRMINNSWLRNDLENNLNKRCFIYSIAFVKVNSAYSSFVGNILYSKNYSDPICSAIEIGRRGFKKFVKGWFYPKIVTFDNLPNSWKDEVNFSYNSWIELYNKIKKMELRYHFSWKNSIDKFQVFSIENKKSLTECITFCNVL